LIHLHPRLDLRPDDARERRHYGSVVVLYELWGDERSARRPRLAVGALILVAIAIGATAPATGASRVVFVVGLAVAVGAWIAWTSRPLPESATVVALALIGVGGTAVVAAGGRGAVAALAFPLIAVAAAAERLPLRLAAVVAGSAFAALLVGALVTRSGFLLVAALVVPPSGFIAGLAPRQHIERVEQAELLLAEAQRAKEEQARAAAFDERMRVAREIHDVLAHSLAALSIRLEVVHALLAEGNASDGLAQVEQSQQLVAQGIAETRDAVAALRADAAPLIVELARLVDGYSHENGFEASFSVEGEPRQLPADTEFACRRITQEALTNARKHAPGALVTARLAYRPSEVRLLVRTVGGSGPGRMSHDGGGYGIAGMRERADLLHGILSAGPVDGGWEVELCIPA
jgi:signal transduction histidine kinase